MRVEGHTPPSSAVLLAVAVCLGAGCAARTPAALPSAPDGLDRWERVLALKPGADLRIRRRSGGVVRGRFRSADGGKVVVADGAAAIGTPRAEVETVAMRTRRVKDFTWRGLLTGAAFGAFAVGASLGSSDELSALVVPFFGGLGAAAGAALGLTPLESLVYEAPPAPPEAGVRGSPRPGAFIYVGGERVRLRSR